ncbi:helix-turn-helix transcriptional regulator [Paenibacillus sp. IB182496]|uniref:Helix-turn-helix transcriptional regulator n=1 Tax=Paenibacillus sabuli TaxID=2772509 RepID=A0A927GQ22_9BACL|nr:AraC family transcriptional regulator [Paenibacillus sabuli]MBD2843918.1 helix-turn-helix transcriptional regulator [Paenibacillus sabuli]
MRVTGSNPQLLDPALLELRFAMEWERAHDWNAPGFSNPYPTIWYMLEGERTLCYQARALRLRPGDLVVIPPDTRFTTQQSDGKKEPVHYLSICLSAHLHGLDWTALYGVPAQCRLADAPGAPAFVVRWRALARLWSEAGAMAARPPEPGQATASPTLDEPRRAPLATTLDEPWHGPDNDGQVNGTGRSDALAAAPAALALRLGGESRLWLADALALLEPHMASPRPAVDIRVLLACAYIRRHYARPLPVPELARQVHVTPGHLRTLFRQTLGLSPQTYVQQTRMQKAKELLLGSEHSLAEIAVRVGYREYGHFLKLFRQSAGCAPSHYRKHTMTER